MTDSLQIAIKALQKLPAADQEAAAHAIMDYTGHDGGVMLNDEQVAEVKRRIKNPDRKFISASKAWECAS